jgi:hypothetical protein
MMDKPMTGPTDEAMQTNETVQTTGQSGADP